MSLILRRKLEAAVTGYLQANAATIGVASDHIFPAASTGTPTGDYLVVSMDRMDTGPDLAEVKRGTLRLKYYSLATVGGSERAAVDVILQKIDAFMMKPANDNATWSDDNPAGGVLRTALNKPASGADSRTVQPLHIYHIEHAEQTGDVDADGWEDQLAYDIIAQPMNSH